MEEIPTLKNATTQAARGSHDAFRAIFDLGGDKVFKYFLGRGCGRDAALDLLQETFIDLWKALPKFRFHSDEEFWGFLFTIARRKLFAHIKEAGKEATLEFLEESAFEMLESPECCDNPEYEDYRALYDALEKINDASKEIIELRHWSELSFREIALATNTSEGAAKVRHHRALKELQAHLPDALKEFYA